ncbi:butyrophilin subfamily 1 member A1 [Tupaia chinensis]|uniref:butyrophilin subfamily 1 member A1 n=1 Tax=Tupaia chinensis TaxID=246437 RepID=UPI0003C8F2E4|nr:butyrophilin subfamily 1 member A1 [Tupaia chinensis]
MAIEMRTIAEGMGNKKSLCSILVFTPATFRTSLILIPALGKMRGSLDFSLPSNLFRILLFQVSMWVTGSILVFTPATFRTSLILIPALGKMRGSLDFSLPSNLFRILLFQVSMWVTDSFSVIGPLEPIVATLGKDTLLPCRVSPAMSVENMELRWFRSQFSEAVYVYQDGKEQVGEQLVDFKGRVELVKDHISEGRVAVRIRNLQVSDHGMYKCFFKKGSDFEEADLELKVIGLGSSPHILIVGLEDEGIKLTCKGQGWFPQPEVQWKNEKGEKIPTLSEKEIQDDDGLFQIESSLVVRDSSKRKVSCSIKTPFSEQEKVETISIPEPFFPRTSPWKVALAVTFPIFVICVFAALFWVRKEKQKYRIICKAKEEKEEESKAKELLKKELDRRKELYLQDWRKAKLYADWRKEQFQAVDVLLDPATAHPNLILSQNGRHVSTGHEVAENGGAPTHQGQSDTIFSVLGQNCLTAGRHYWEVEVNRGTEVESGTRWALGVCSQTVKREGWFKESPEKNFWVLAWEEGKIMIPTSKLEIPPLKQHPHRIGVFLDWDGGDVSFYNMLDGSHIYSFAGIVFNGVLCPYFSIQGAGASMTILLASDGIENCPDSSQKPSDTVVPQETKPLLPS